MTKWFVDDDFEDLRNRRITEQAGYKVQEEKIGGVEYPDYTMLTVFEEDEVVAGATYKGDGGGLRKATESYTAEDFEYNNPVSLLDNPELRADGEGDISDLFDLDESL
jgi:hypothetical protein